MPYETLVFRVHAIRRMFLRRIDQQTVRDVLTRGEVIREYPEDKPYPSRLVLGFIGRAPLHVVAADNHAARETIVITVYEPDPTLWESDFRRKKR